MMFFFIFSAFISSRQFSPHFRRLPITWWHIGAVAASKHYPAGDKLVFRTAFSSGSIAAIEPIC